MWILLLMKSTDIIFIPIGDCTILIVLPTELVQGIVIHAPHLNSFSCASRLYSANGLNGHAGIIYYDLTAYCTAGNFGEVFNLAIWRIW